MDYRTIKPILEFSQCYKSVLCVRQTQNLAIKKKERKAKYLTKEHSTEKGGFYFTKQLAHPHHQTRGRVKKSIA